MTTFDRYLRQSDRLARTESGNLIRWSNGHSFGLSHSFETGALFAEYSKLVSTVKNQSAGQKSCYGALRGNKIFGRRAD